MKKKEIAYAPERIELLRHLIRYHKLNVLVINGEKVADLECVTLAFRPYDTLLVDWLLESIETYDKQQAD